MRVSYNADPYSSEYNPAPGGLSWGAGLAHSFALHVRYSGELDLEPGNALPALFGELHEMGHIMQVAYLGMTGEAYDVDKLKWEAQAWGIGRCWVKRSLLRQYDAEARGCLETYRLVCPGDWLAQELLRQERITWS